MIIQRKRQDNFSIIPNAVANDERLSFAARGLLCYLLSKPNDWTVMLEDIKRAGGIGKDKAYSLLAELIDVGYVQRSATRDASGRITSHDYLVFDISMGAELPLPEPSPLPEKPQVANPLPENPQVDVNSGENKPLPALPLPAKPLPANPDVLIRTESDKEKEGASAETLWAQWPEKHRTTSAAAAAQLAKKPAHEIALAVAYAKDWRSRQMSLGNAPTLERYLRMSGWQEMAGAPPFDSDGYFRITKAFPNEWSAWLIEARRRYGVRGEEQLAERGFILTKTRFPEGTRKAAA